jgi:hypothetical protein
MREESDPTYFVIMRIANSYTFGLGFDDELNIVPEARVHIPLKEQTNRTLFTHYQDRYTYQRGGVLVNKHYLSQ